MSRKRTTDDGDELLARLGALTAQARERAELQRSLVELAVALQRGMLPGEMPVAPGFHLAVRYSPAFHGLNVGGDWYDAFRMPDGRICLSIGDVQGHNIEAAAFMGQVRVGLRALASVTSEPGELLSRTNDLLLSLGSDLFATCTFMRLDPSTGVLESARAGHIPSVWATADGQSGIAEDEGGPPAGHPPGQRVPGDQLPAHHGRSVRPGDGRRGGRPLTEPRRRTRPGGEARGRRRRRGHGRVLPRRGRDQGRERVGHEDDAAVLVVGHDAPDTGA